jgi:hypothetical protein
MSRTLATLVFALAMSLGAGSLASADPVRASGSPAPKAQSEAGEKRLQRHHRRAHDRRHYRGRHYRDRHYRDRRHGWRQRYGHRSRWDHGRHYQRGYYRRGPSCWHERRHSRYRGRPAVVSTRICRDRYGRQYVDRGTRRLVYYVAPRHRRYRRW